jgi:hypothetical protein
LRDIFDNVIVYDDFKGDSGRRRALVSARLQPRPFRLARAATTEAVVAFRLHRVGNERTVQPRIPVSTYRLQFNRDFTFEHARALVEYFCELGVTDFYSSPILKARPGSPHGYDIVDHAQVNPEVGTEEQLVELARTLRERGMGVLVDVVPNHMCIAGSENRWWQDVLENGPGLRALLRS